MIQGLAFAVLGTILGSFLNVCIDRMPRDRSLIAGRSHCDACGQQLRILDLIPIISYLALRGKCRYCGAAIPLRVPLVESGAGALFFLIWLRYPANLEAFLIGGYSAILIIILFIDLEHHRILNKLSYPAIALALLASPFIPGRSALEMLTGGALGFGFLLILALLYPAGMGMGDVKLAAFIGLAVGHPGIVLALFLAFVLGGFLSGGLVLAKKMGRRDPIAFGPFLAAGAITTMLYGEPILNWWAGRT